MPFGPTNKSSSQPGTFKPAVLPQWARHYNTQGGGTWANNDENGPTRYEQFIYAMTHDERFQREVTLGKRIGLYKFRGELGTGNFSKVKLGYHQLAHERVAIKIIDKMGMDQRASRMLSREIATMDRVRHPSIVRLYEVMETISKVYLVMEVAPFGEVFTHVNNHGRYDETSAQNLFAQLVSAIDYMHDSDLYHRDIKAENVFLASPDRIRLGDFGFSTQLMREVENPMLTTFCGSPPYAAPELFNDDAYSGAAVDIWALGVLLFFMTTSTMPFTGQTVAGLKQSIVENSYLIPNYISETCADLIRGLLKTNPKERLMIGEVKDHLWLSGQSFQNPLANYYFVPTINKSQRNELENRVVVRLCEIGITEAMLAENADGKGGRSPVVGTYRVLMHRMDRTDPAVFDSETINLAISEPSEQPEPKPDSNPVTSEVNGKVKGNDTNGTSSSNRSPGKEKIKHKLASMGFNSKKHSSKTCTIL